MAMLSVSVICYALLRAQRTDYEKKDCILLQYEDTCLFRILENGICDMEAGRELPLADAFQKVAELREHRRHARL